MTATCNKQKKNEKHDSCSQFPLYQSKAFNKLTNTSKLIIQLPKRKKQTTQDHCHV